MKIALAILTLVMAFSPCFGRAKPLWESDEDTVKAIERVLQDGDVHSAIEIVLDWNQSHYVELSESSPEEENERYLSIMDIKRSADGFLFLLGNQEKVYEWQGSGNSEAASVAIFDAIYGIHKLIDGPSTPELEAIRSTYYRVFQQAEDLLAEMMKGCCYNP